MDLERAAYPARARGARLTREGAKDIYRRDYWNALGLDAVDNQGGASALFDFAVNAGISRAKTEAQAALKDLGIVSDKGAGLIPAINAAGGKFANALMEKRLSFYQNLATSKPATYQKYLAGWEKRAKSFFSSAAGATVTAAASKKTYLVLAGLAGLGLGYWYFKKKKRA